MNTFPRPFLNSLPVVVVAAAALSLPHVVHGQQGLLGGGFPPAGSAEQHLNVPGQAAFLLPSGFWRGRTDRPGAGFPVV